MLAATTPTKTVYQFRIDEREKAETFAVFANMGLKPAQAVRLFFRQVRETKSIPFPIEYSVNKQTGDYLLAPNSEKEYQSFDSIDALLADLKSE